MYGTARANGYGYSLWEFQVYGEAGATPTATNPPTATATRTPTPTATAPTGNCGATNAALGKPAAASSVWAGNTAAMAVDGIPGTRWESAWSDPQWLQVDLGGTLAVCRVALSWEAAYATAYQIQISHDGSSWTTIKTVTGGDGGADDHAGLSGNGRYMRVYGTARANGYGYSLFEFEVFTQ